MKKFTLLTCLCLKCKWTWEVLSVKADREQNCPECKSFDVFTHRKGEH